MRQIVRAVLLVLALLSPLAAQEQDDTGSVFTRPALNSGLPARPEALDLDTPRTAMETFLAAAEDERWEAAAHVLDLNQVAPEDQETAGPALAQQLHSILDRKVLIRWSDLPDRPDGMIERGGRDDPLVGERRRSFSLGVVAKGDRPVTIRLNRTRAEGGSPV